MAMRILETSRTQSAVYWAAPIPDGRGGFNFTAAVELVVRWEDKAEQFLSIDNEEKISNAVVYVPEVSTGVEVVVGGWMRNGALTGSEETDPEQEDGAYRIERFDKLPTLKGDEFLRTVYL